ncbi:hypothetical protein MZK49_05650 [Ensifer sesbaniae]|uniref:hypothetical protein n=1 Tax=Ensifer sesbaniae TaxID=1214071 RepID=UPI0020014439|nr:hypothetical protein [Ensifer sesbaniae]
MDNLNINVGDLVTHGTFLLRETPLYREWLIREGELMYLHKEMKEEALAALISQNQQEANDFNYSGSHGSMVKVASIPELLYWELHRKGITDDPVAYRRFLNDPNNAKFRTNTWTV